MQLQCQTPQIPVMSSFEQHHVIFEAEKLSQRFYLYELFIH